MRTAEHADIDYFIKAGMEFCEYTPFSFDAESYAVVIHNLVDDADCVAIVDGDPVKCHSVAKLIPNFYNADEIVAKVFTTWGPGGLKCFAEVERICKARGARFLMADSMIAPRVQKFYERRGMTQQDSVFIKELSWA